MKEQYIAVLGNDTKTFNYGESTPFFKRLLAYGQGLGLNIYVFSLIDIDFDNEIIYGNYLENGDFKKGKFPFPVMIYDRAFQAKNRDFYYQKLLAKGCIFLNDSSLLELSTDKWSIYELFQNKESLNFVSPKTALYSRDNLLNLFSAFSKIIFKPRFGSGGRGIFSVEKLLNDKYKLSLNNEIYSLAGLLNYFEQIKLSDYLIQEMINIKKYQDRVFDIRVLFQRSEFGKWEISGVVARVAAPKEIRANLHQGGEALSLGVLFTDFYGAVYYEKQFKEKLYNASEEIFSTIIKEARGETVELALDFILDESGKLFFIESGARPGRRAFRIFGQEVHDRISYAPIKYMNFLLKSQK